MRRHELGEATRRDDRRVGRLELAANRRDDPVDLAREAVDQPRLEAADRRLADHAGRLDVVHLHEPRSAREERVHRRLDPGREDAADVVAVGRHDVEVRRRPEVDDDHGRAEARLRGDRVDDPIGTDLARVVVADRDPGADARADGEERGVRPAAGEPFPFAEEHRDGRREADPVDRVGVEQPAEEDDELVTGPAPVGRDAPVVDEPVAVEQPEHGLRVADVDGEKHGASV